MRSPAGAPGSRLPAPRGAPCRTARARSAQLRVRSALTPCGTGVTAGSASSRFRSPSQNIWLNLEITFLIARKRNMTNRLTTRLASENHFPWTMERLVFSLVAGTEFFMIHLLGCIPSRFFPTSSGCQLLSLSFLKSPILNTIVYPVHIQLPVQQPLSVVNTSHSVCTALTKLLSFRFL